MRVGLVVDAQDFPEARRPAYRLLIDFGPLGVKRSSAQVTAHYRPQDLIGRHVIAVVNFAPKQIGPFVSEVLVMGAYDERGDVVLLGVDQPVAGGSQIGWPGAGGAAVASSPTIHASSRRACWPRTTRDVRWSCCFSSPWRSRRGVRS